MVRMLLAALLLCSCAVEHTGLPGRGDDAAAADASRIDAMARDAMAPRDGGDDAGPGTCPSRSDPDTVLFFSFEDAEGASTIRDRANDHDARVENGTGTPVPGPAGCGLAFRFDDSDAPYLVIPDDASFDLDRGSVDFHLRADELDRTRGVVSRDAFGTTDPGHLRIIIESDDDLEVRIQDTGDRNRFVDTNGAFPTDRWVHVGVNWGPGGLELWIDGRLEDADSHEGGIDGNDNPWVIGTSNQRASEGSDPPSDLEYGDPGIALDNLRVSSIRRDFSAFRP